MGERMSGQLPRYAAKVVRPLAILGMEFVRFVDGCEKMEAMGEINRMKYLLEHRDQYRGVRLPEIPASPFSIYRFARRNPYWFEDVVQTRIREWGEMQRLTMDGYPVYTPALVRRIGHTPERRHFMASYASI